MSTSPSEASQAPPSTGAPGQAARACARLRAGIPSRGRSRTGAGVLAAVWALLAVWASLAVPTAASGVGGHAPSGLAAGADVLVLQADLLEPGVARPDGAKARSSSTPNPLERDGPKHERRLPARRPGLVLTGTHGALDAPATDRALTLRDLSASVHPDLVHAPPFSA